MKSAAGAAALAVARSAGWAQCCACQASGAEGAAGAAGPTAEGQWRVLFDGKSLDQWDLKPDAWKIEADGSMYSDGKGGDIWSKEKYQDFAYEVEFKVAKGSNSGVFLRVEDRKNWLHSGMEIQVYDSAGKKDPSKYDCGALYDCQAPSANPMKPAGEWNKFQITCFKSRIWIALNGVPIQDIDLSKWTEAHKNPDGTKNKFNRAYNTMTHAGYLSFQGHGNPVSYRNVRVKVLDPAKGLPKCPKCGMEGPEGWCPMCSKAAAAANK